MEAHTLSGAAYRLRRQLDRRLVECSGEIEDVLFLFIRFGYRQAASKGNATDCFFRCLTQCNQHAGHEQRGTTNTLPTMEANILAAQEFVGEQSCNLGSLSTGFWDVAVNNREMVKLKAGTGGESFFLQQIQIRNFVFREKLNDRVDPRTLPFENIVFQPIATTRPSKDCKPTRTG